MLLGMKYKQFWPFINKLAKWLLLHTGSRFQWYRTYERGYETSGSPLRFMLRRSSLVECVSVLHGTCSQSVEFFFIRQYVHPCLSKNLKYTIYTIKSSLTLAYYLLTVHWPISAVEIVLQKKARACFYADSWVYFIDLWLSYKVYHLCWHEFTTC